MCKIGERQSIRACLVLERCNCVEMQAYSVCVRCVHKSNVSFVPERIIASKSGNHFVNRYKFFSSVKLLSIYLLFIWFVDCLNYFIFWNLNGTNMFNLNRHLAEECVRLKIVTYVNTRVSNIIAWCDLKWIAQSNELQQKEF